MVQLISGGAVDAGSFSPDGAAAAQARKIAVTAICSPTRRVAFIGRLYARTREADPVRTTHGGVAEREELLLVCGP